MDAITKLDIDATALEAALALVRGALPTAVAAHLSTSDQDCYGFVLSDVELPAGALSDLDPALLDRLAEHAAPELADLDWDRVVGEDASGFARLEL